MVWASGPEGFGPCVFVTWGLPRLWAYMEVASRHFIIIEKGVHIPVTDCTIIMGNADVYHQP